MRIEVDNAADLAAGSLDGDLGPSLRSPLGLMALRQLNGVGWLVSLRIALFCPVVVPHIDRHRSQWEKALESAREELELCQEAGVTVISIFDKDYPERLRALQSPPPLLYVLGCVGLLNRARTAVLVGAAEQTPSGIAATERIATTLAEAGWTLVSSIAGEVEAHARNSAHAVGSPTVCVLGQGLRAPGTEEKEKLAEEVLSTGGALVSATPFGTSAISAAKGVRSITAGLSVTALVPDVRLTDSMRQSIQTTVLQGRPVICVRHAKQDGEDEKSSSRVLLELPAKDIPKTAPGWRGRVFAAVLGDLPLAEEAPETPHDLLARLDRAVDAELRDPLPPRWWFGLEYKDSLLLDARAATRQLRADAGFRAEAA